MKSDPYRMEPPPREQRTGPTGPQPTVVSVTRPWVGRRPSNFAAEEPRGNRDYATFCHGAGRSCPLCVQWLPPCRCP